MKYDLKPMIKIQTDLNNEIYKTQKLKREDIKDQTHLCIIIELMELCNETRCFNYWSKKQCSADDVILEEFADVLCFLLTELIQLNISEIEIDETITKENKIELTTRFYNLVKDYGKLAENKIDDYKNFTQDLFNLGYALGYNINSIYESYLKKVAKNYQVQEEFKK